MGAWRIFFHPRRAARELSDLQLRLHTAESENQELQSSLESAREESAGLRGALREAEAQQRLLTERLLSLERDMEADKQLYDAQEAQIQELVAQFEKVHEMSEAYEARISRLKKKLADTRRQLNLTLRDAEAELTPVPPLPPVTPPPADPAPEPEHPSEDEADWYITPPEL